MFADGYAGAACAGGDDLRVRPGFWRSSPSSSEVILPARIIGSRYKDTRLADISIIGWNFGRQNRKSPFNVVSINLYFDKWMGSWAMDHMLLSRLDCTRYSLVLAQRLRIVVVFWGVSSHLSQLRNVN